MRKINSKRTNRRAFSSLLMVFLIFRTISVYCVDAGIQPGRVQVSGSVTDIMTTEPLPGVTIIIKGTSSGTITDMDGNYTIDAGVGEILVYSFIGYLPEEYAVSTETVLNVALSPDIIGLDEVVVTGYGVQKRSDLTGAIASVNGEDLAKLPTGSIDDALKGRAAGVFSASETGAPGSAAVIKIRGNSSTNGGDPLIIIDGVPSSIWSINSLNASDIASMEILKDASSQAIYGASGGNGVILITTKKGDKNKLTAQLDYYYGYQVPKDNVDMLSTEEYFEVYNQIEGLPANLQRNLSADSIASLPNTNWLQELTRSAPMQSVNLSVSGGNENSIFRFSTGYFKQLGTVPNSDYDRFNLRLNSEHKISKRITIGENLSLTRENYKGFVSWYFNNLYASPVFLALKMHPFVEPYVEGAEPLNYAWGQSTITPGLENPFVRVDIINREVPTYRINGDMNIAIDIVKGLTFKSIAGYGLDMGYAKEFNPVYQFSSTIANATENFNRTAWRNYSWYLQNHITYNFSLGNQNLSLMAGYESGYYMNEGFIATGTGLLGEDETMHYYNTVTGTVEVQDYNTIQEVASDAFFGRLNWDYKGKYLLTSNIRRDQSSKFGPAMRTGIFPSVSAGWKFSEESFMDGLSWLSFGKIRAGWGKIGNSDIRVYQYYARVINTDVYDYPIDNIASSPGVASHGIANLSLHWEAMKSSNAGIDLTFLSNKISFSFDYFQKENEGMLINRPTPTLVGTHIINAGNEGGETQLVDNVGGVKTKGYETTIGYKTTTGAFEHNFNLNFSQVTNIVGFVGGDTILDGDAIGVSPNFTAEGFPMGVFYGLKTDGLFQESDGILQDDGTWLITNQPFTLDDDGAPIYAQPFAQPGDVRFQDINGDGRVNTEDRAIIGNPHPKHLLGFSYDLRYKLFDFSMFWQGAFGHDIIQVTKFYFYNNSGVYNWEDEIKDRWTPENTDAEIFRLTYLDRNNNDQFSDFYVEPGDYLRLKNIQIGFTMPKTLTSKVNIESFRLYLSVKDAITITKYGGVDPEISTSRNPIAAGIDVSAYPRPIVYTAGINVVF